VYICWETDQSVFCMTTVMLMYSHTITVFAGVWQEITPSSVPVWHQWAGAVSASTAAATSDVTSTVLTTSCTLPSTASPATSGELTTSTLSVHAGILQGREITFKDFLWCMRPFLRLHILLPDGTVQFTAHYLFSIHCVD